MIDREMVERIERAENDAFTAMYRAAADLGTAVVEIDGVTTVWSRHDDDPGYNCIINLTDASDPHAAIMHIEAAARADGAIVLGIDGSPETIDAVGEDRVEALGFRADYQEHMWGRRLERSELDHLAEPPDAPIVRRVRDAESDAFARILNIGYDLPEDSVRGHIFAATLGLPGWIHYLVEYDGQPGSASVMYVTDGVAQLFVATTMPDFRGRGGQAALIRHRLRDALELGADLATSQTGTENASPRNMQRRGFELLYTRWILGKPLTG